MASGCTSLQTNRVRLWVSRFFPWLALLISECSLPQSFTIHHLACTHLHVEHINTWSQRLPIFPKDWHLRRYSFTGFYIFYPITSLRLSFTYFIHHSVSTFSHNMWENLFVLSCTICCFLPLPNSSSLSTPIHTPCLPPHFPHLLPLRLGSDGTCKWRQRWFWPACCTGRTGFATQTLQLVSKFWLLQRRELDTICIVPTW